MTSLGYLQPASARLRRGFTLIEVMAASTIFLTIFVALMSGYMHMERLNTHQRHTTHGIHIAQGMMEELILLRRENVALASGTVHSRVVDQEGNVNGAGKYTVSWEITPNNPVTGVRRMDVGVSWNEAAGGTRSLSLFTYRN